MKTLDEHYRSLIDKSASHMEDHAQLNDYYTRQSLKNPHGHFSESQAENYIEDSNALGKEYMSTIKPHLSEIIKQDSQLRRLVTAKKFSPKAFERTLGSKLNSFVSESGLATGVSRDVVSEIPSLVTSLL